MAKQPIATDPNRAEIQAALEKIKTWNDGLDQVFKKLVVAEALLMHALSNYDAQLGISEPQLHDLLGQVGVHLLNAKKALAIIKVRAKSS